MTVTAGRWTFSRARIFVLLGLACALPAAPTPAQAQGALVVYCGVQEEWCRAMVNAFQRETGITVAMTRRSSGETYAQVKAEASNPRGDIWWGGTGDPHLQAAEEGLTIDYRSPNLDQLQRDPPSVLVPLHPAHRVGTAPGQGGELAQGGPDSLNRKRTVVVAVGPVATAFVACGRALVVAPILAIPVRPVVVTPHHGSSPRSRRRAASSLASSSSCRIS